MQTAASKTPSTARSGSVTRLNATSAAEALASLGQHRVGCVDAGDAVAACDQLAREEAGAAAEIEHGAHALRVGAPELMEE